MKSIRGAIAVVDNNELSIISSAKSLILSVMKENNITEEDIVFALFTVTQDLDQAFPAKAFRELGMNSIAAIDTVAPNIGSFSDSEITFICISDVCALAEKHVIIVSIALNMYLFIENVNIN